MGLFTFLQHLHWADFPPPATSLHGAQIFLFLSPLCGCLFVFVSFFSGLIVEENVLYMGKYPCLVLSRGKKSQ